MKTKIFNSIFLVSLILIFLITAVVSATTYSSYSASQAKQLKEEAQLVIRGVELNGNSYFSTMNFTEYRITWIKEDGQVIYDSSKQEGELVNHLEREEVQEAITGGYGEAKRFSSTILKESIYVAYRIEDGSIIRLSCLQNTIFYLLVSTLYPIYFIAFLALVVSMVLAFTLSKKIIDPLNKLDLENIDIKCAYPELEPLLNRISCQAKQLLEDKKEIEKNSSLRQEFTSNVTHEMKTPLHVIAGYSELMKEGMVKDEEVKKFSSKIYLESYRLTKLVDDILKLSKLDNGVLDEEKKYISLDSIAKNVIDSLIPIADERGISIHSKLDSVEIFGSADIIHSLIYNLVENAIKYNKDNGDIDVIVEKRRSKKTLIITDTGIGIPSNEIDRIFERFYRVDKSRSREIGGTGLGLSIVKHAAIVHDAKIDVESTIGEGTTFTVTF